MAYDWDEERRWEERRQEERRQEERRQEETRQEEMRLERQREERRQEEMRREARRRDDRFEEETRRQREESEWKSEMADRFIKQGNIPAAAAVYGYAIKDNSQPERRYHSGASAPEIPSPSKLQPLLGAPSPSKLQPLLGAPGRAAQASSTFERFRFHTLPRLFASDSKVDVATCVKVSRFHWDGNERDQFDKYAWEATQHNSEGLYLVFLRSMIDDKFPSDRGAPTDITDLRAAISKRLDLLQKS
jgi:hypothetical protein